MSPRRIHRLGSQLIVPSHLRPPHAQWPAAGTPLGPWYIAGLTQSHYFAADSVVDGGGLVQSVPDRMALEDLVKGAGGHEATIGVWGGDGGDAWQFGGLGVGLQANGWGLRAAGIRIPTTCIYLIQFQTPGGSSYPTPVSFWGTPGLYHNGPRRNGGGSTDWLCYRAVPDTSLTQDNGSFNYDRKAIGWKYDGQYHRFWVNSVDMAPYDTYTGSVTNTDAALTKHTLGAIDVNTDAAKCMIAEHHVYLGALTDAQIVTVSDDMIARRGI